MEENNEVSSKKSPVRTIILILVLVVAGYFAFKKISFALSHETTDDAQVATQITPVLPRVSGYIKNVYVNDYDSVKAGQLVAVVDASDLEADLAEMEANLQASKADLQASEADLKNAQAGVVNAQSSIDPSQGSITLNQVKLRQAQEDYQRNLNLFKDQAITKKQLDDSRYNLEAATQQIKNGRGDLQTVKTRVNVTQAAIGKANANISKAQASIKSQEAKIAAQKLKISYTQIFAPVTGKLGKNNIVAGQYVQAGSPIFSIVNDTTFWVVANFKETQIRKFHPGMEVELKLDAYPDETLHGKLSSVSVATGAQFSLLPPDNASGNFVKVTQRVPVKIDITDVAKHRNILRAGLSADVIIPVK